MKRFLILLIIILLLALFLAGCRKNEGSQDLVTSDYKLTAVLFYSNT
jgi:PBP1b-binding outer membrane lipoprotein LpoB